MPDSIKQKIQPREISEELKESYLDYAMSVIVARALPDVRDGLKPVQRRVLWAMWEAGLTHLAKFRKSANIVGETMAKYHPHGDMAIYDTLVRLAQDFAMRYPLVAGQGNMGSIDGDNAAAMRYCVSGDTLVVTDRGLVPIEEISENNTEDIDIKVLSKDRVVNKATKWFDSGEHPTIKIKTKNGFSLCGTANHPILTWMKSEITGAPTFRWKLLGDLKKGDVAVLDRTPDLLWPQKKVLLKEYWPERENSRVQEKILPDKLDEDLAHILGALLSEGTVEEKKIEFCNTDHIWIDEFHRRWRKVFPDCRLHHFSRRPSSFGKKPYERLEIHSRQVIEFLRNIGLAPLKSAGKRVPFSILRSPEEVAASFLRAYFEGDGSISWSGKMTELSCCSASGELIGDLQLLLLRFGIVGTRRFDSLRNIHKLYIRGLKNYVLFQEKIGFISSRKNKKLKEAVARLRKDYSQTDFVPFISDFVRENVLKGAIERQFVEKNNFDRYSTMQKNYVKVAAATGEMQPRINAFFELLLKQNYIFDRIVEIEPGGVKRVYSLKVESDCHSFVANGFINHNTETKLAKIAEEMLVDIEKDTVDWRQNYDGTRDEPTVLPAKLPNLLLNGTLGIAVGMATSIPPHNLTEVADAALYLADNPDATSEDLMKFIKGPDFPTGGIIFDEKAIKAAYVSGRGGITMRAKAEIVERGAKNFNIIITEIPYQVNKSELVKKIAELVQEKKVEGIRDLRDESDREGLRIVVELKNDVPPQKVLNQLYEHTDLQKDFHLNAIALQDGIQPQLFSIKDLLAAYLAHRKVVVRRRTQFELKRAEERAHILEGLHKALAVIDKVIATIKRSADKEEAHENLVKIFKLTDIQAAAILEMRLSALAALERRKIEDELKEKKALIEELGAILRSPAKILKVIKDEIKELKETYGDKRRTQVVATPIKAFKEEDLIPDEDVIVTFSAGGYIKRLSPGTFRAQKRGGKGLIGSEVAEDDFLSQFFSAKTHDNVLFFTDRGRVFQTKVYEIPQGSRTAKGRAIHNFLELPADENVSAIVSYADARRVGADQHGRSQRQSASSPRESAFLVMVTKNGLIKKTALEEFENIRRTGIIAISLKKGDLLRWVKLSSGKDEVIVTTRQGQSIRFRETQVRPMGRAAAGVRAIRLRKGDEVAGFDIIQYDADRHGRETQISADKISINQRTHPRESALLVVMENGFGKQTPLAEYKTQKRGGLGIRTAKITSKTGPLVSAHVVGAEGELFALSAKGQILRTSLQSVRKTGRVAQGVRIMNLKAGDRLVGTVVI